MKNKNTIPVMVSAAVLLAACGGEGGGSKVTPSTNKSSFNLTGTVSGALIQAFCDDGSHYSVNSEYNGTSKQPFLLTLPTSLPCRLIMSSNNNDPYNKVVTPIKFTNQNGISSITFSGLDDLNLDHVELALRRYQMSSDKNNDGVEDEPKEVILDGFKSKSIDVIDEPEDPLDEDNDDIIDIYDGDHKDEYEDEHDDDHEDEHDDDDDDHEDEHDDDHENEHDDDHEDEHDDDHEDDDENEGVNPPSDPVVTTLSAGRLLASQCAQCHGTDANPHKGFENLAGEEIYGDLIEMIEENKPELMHLQANGYTEEQIRLMDEYFNSLSESKGDEQ